MNPFRLLLTISFVTLFALPLVSCKHESPVVGICLGNDGNSQDCGIACKVTKDARACAKWADLTRKICGKVTKEECQAICTKDENPTACDLVKSMK